MNSRQSRISAVPRPRGTSRSQAAVSAETAAVARLAIAAWTARVVRRFGVAMRRPRPEFRGEIAGDRDAALDVVVQRSAACSINVRRCRAAFARPGHARHVRLRRTRINEVIFPRIPGRAPAGSDRYRRGKAIAIGSRFTAVLSLRNELASPSGKLGLRPASLARQAPRSFSMQACRNRVEINQCRVLH